MIEVEKRFQPTEEQLAKLLADSAFLEKKVNHDIYYDFSDNKLFKSYVKFRSRNGNFEIKNIPSKGQMYFKIVKPELYEKLFNR